MKKETIIKILFLIVLLDTAAVIYLIYRPVTLEIQHVSKVVPMLKPSDIYCPETFDLAGEYVPLKRTDIAEAFRKELIVNTYLHSHTIQVLKNVSRYFPIIEPILEEEGIPDDFKYLAVIESSLNPLAVSPAGAVGLWQFMSGTAKELGMEVNKIVDERYHIEKSTRAACAYLKKAKEKFGTWVMAAASYNAGMNMLTRQINLQKENNYYDLLLGEETGRYVFRIMAMKQIIENPHLYDFHVSEKYEVEKCEEVKVNKNIKDLAHFANTHGISYKTLKRFNPWLRANTLHASGKKSYYIASPRQPEKYR